MQIGFGDWFIKADMSQEGGVTKRMVMDSVKEGGVELLKFKKFNNAMSVKEFLRFMAFQTDPARVP